MVRATRSKRARQALIRQYGISEEEFNARFDTYGIAGCRRRGRAAPGGAIAAGQRGLTHSADDLVENFRSRLIPA
jgi:hypothetical protein